MQVFQQALHRQPNTAAQYLQQMYAAQQQHLMLQTAALQQQHSLSTAQLQSLAAVQQVSKWLLNERIILTVERLLYYHWPLVRHVLGNAKYMSLLPPLALSCLEIGQYRSWPAKLFTKWHFIPANRIYSGHGKCNFECWVCLLRASKVQVIFVY